jgi:hypothetical protein
MRTNFTNNDNWLNAILLIVVATVAVLFVLRMIGC